MHWLECKNNESVNLNNIPCLNMTDFRNEIIYHCYDNKRIIGYFGVKKEEENVLIYAILANDTESKLMISSTLAINNSSYQSITEVIPSFHIYERELYEENGIKPVNHPWLKPVHYGVKRFNKENTMEKYPFFKMAGEEIHEVAVGPVHAGVIEPGHFRFMCEGEKIHHLEIQLGYQHRNIEELFTLNKNQFKNQLAESIAGDTVIGHNLTYSNAIESLAGIQISNKADIIRLVALEMERIAIHIGDLGAISNDIAYLMGNAVFGATRTLVINTLLEISGSRFGRGLIRIGGVTFDINDELKEKIKTMLSKISKDVDRMVKTMVSSSTVMSRLEKTGTVETQKARIIGLIGMAARASGVEIDTRIDHPFGYYAKLNIEKEILTTGDVYARMYIRYLEINQSIKIINTLLEELNNYKNETLIIKNKKLLKENSMVVSIVEGWRGEIIHSVLTDEKGNISKYKIKDPSFNNWYGLSQAVKNNGISDFPLCNKSFNLSYCGTDL
ncbi:MAG: NADH-quinone oxidoreductase subunit C [Vampirovibrionia bacterium]